MTVGAKPLAATNPIAGPPATDAFAIGDLVRIRFSGAEGWMPPHHEEHIKEDGTFTLSFIGPVKAEGKTPEELMKEIHERYVPRLCKRLTVTFDDGQNVY